MPVSQQAGRAKCWTLDKGEADRSACQRCVKWSNSIYIFQRVFIFLSMSFIWAGVNICSCALAKHIIGLPVICFCHFTVFLYRFYFFSSRLLFSAPVVLLSYLYIYIYSLGHRKCQQYVSSFISYQAGDYVSIYIENNTNRAVSILDKSSFSGLMIGR